MCINCKDLPIRVNSELFTLHNRRGDYLLVSHVHSKPIFRFDGSDYRFPISFNLADKHIGWEFGQSTFFIFDQYLGYRRGIAALVPSSLHELERLKDTLQEYEHLNNYFPKGKIMVI